jgi:2-polyprenyl-3-methyl-5-hydroxy-6-metoxy-1,4-benzoquinol methylase
MKITADHREYLIGNKFDSYVKFKPEYDNEDYTLINRQDYLLKVLKGKKVIHVGCIDHVVMIEEKIKNNTWLHSEITKVAKKNLGVDINEEGIRFVREKLQIENIINCDLTNSAHISSTIVEEKWDYIVLGEILEHVDNPVHFLEQIKKNYGHVIQKIIITVPNAFYLRNIEVVLLKKYEQINSDHRYWFTPFTLAKVMLRAGIEIDSFRCLLMGAVNARGFFHKIIYKKFPMLRTGIVMIGNLK